MRMDQYPDRVVLFYFRSYGRLIKSNVPDCERPWVRRAVTWFPY